MTQEDDISIGELHEGPLYNEILEVLETVILEEAEKEDSDINPEDLPEKTSEIVEEVIGELAEDQFEEIMENFDEGLSKWRNNMSGFESRLSETWGDPFDMLEGFIVYNYDIGTQFVEQTQESVDEDDYVYIACKLLHARALQISREILVLMRNGFVDGALARWRSLDEITVASIFIRKHGNETARRFLDHRVYEDEFLAQLIDDHGSQINESIDEEEMERLKETLEELKEEHEGFGGLVGWAAKDIEERATWFQLHKETNLEQMLPYYSYASTNVHGGSKGTQHSAGTPNIEELRQEPTRFGPTNSGFSLPADLTAISLSGATMSFVLTRPSLEMLVDLYAINNYFLDHLRQEFTESQKYIDEKERERIEWWEEYLEDAEPDDLIEDFGLDEDVFEQQD